MVTARACRYGGRSVVVIVLGVRRAGGDGAGMHPLTSHRSLLTQLVPELPLPGEDHRDIVPVGRLDHLGVVDGAARLDDGADPRGRRFLDPVWEGEEGVAGER